MSTWGVGLSSFLEHRQDCIHIPGQGVEDQRVGVLVDQNRADALLVLSAVRKDCMFFCSWSAAANLTGHDPG